ncbi:MULTISPECIES: hypothetical protein [unclassified Azospirillum]|uniref:hypothetical protein n=1 Tax=unclassified Azospirillum TaxID=2630922 RepID=UPI0018EE55CA|nr:MULTISPECIES: hypothetical protein [unclassified Azospirillum]
MDQNLNQGAGRRFGAIDDGPPAIVPAGTGTQTSDTLQIGMIADPPELHAK